MKGVRGFESHSGVTELSESRINRLFDGSHPTEKMRKQHSQVRALGIISQDLVFGNDVRTSKNRAADSLGYSGTAKTSKLPPPLKLQKAVERTPELVDESRRRRAGRQHGVRNSQPSRGGREHKYRQRDISRADYAGNRGQRSLIVPEMCDWRTHSHKDAMSNACTWRVCFRLNLLVYLKNL